jgi:hypothetical protein
VPSSPPPDAFLKDVRNRESQLWQEIDAHIKAAKAAFAEYKRLGPEAAKAKGVEQSWNEEVKSLLATCVTLGLAVKGVKDGVMAEVGERAGNVGKGIALEIPEARTGKRYAEGWIIGKVVKA